MEILKTRCLVLKNKKINEADLSATVFTREYGKMNIMAYGIRKSRKRNPITLNPLSLVDMTIQKKNGFYTVNDSELIKKFGNITNDIEKLEISLYILDSINKLYDINYEDKDFFDKLIDILKFINTREKRLKGYKYYIILSFLRRIMIEQGIYHSDEIEKILDFELILKYREISLINKKYSDEHYILKEFEKYSVYLKKIIISFEKYINENLQVKMEMKKFLTEEL